MARNAIVRIGAQSGRECFDSGRPQALHTRRLPAAGRGPGGCSPLPSTHAKLIREPYSFVAMATRIRITTDSFSGAGQELKNCLKDWSRLWRRRR